MYSLNVNFLKDRPELQQGAGGKAKKAASGPSLTGQAPIVLGAIVGIGLPALVAAAYLFLGMQIANNQKRSDELADQLAELEAEIARGEQAEAETRLVDEQTQALAEVFGRVTSWAAIFQDVRDRLPDGTQLQTFGVGDRRDSERSRSRDEDEEGEGPPPPPPRSNLTLVGYANSVERVGEFLLLLKQSEFLDPEETELVRTAYTDNPADLQERDPEFPDERVEGINYTLVNPEDLEARDGEVGEFPQIVEFEIATKLADTSSAELISELQANGAVGLAARLEAVDRILEAREPVAAPPDEEAEGETDAEAEADGEAAAE